MIRKGVEGEIARNGLTIFPWYLAVLKLTRRFVLTIGDFRGLALTIDLRRDHSMYRPPDCDSPSLTCRHCFVSAHFWIGPTPQPKKEWPREFCSGKRYRWSSRKQLGWVWGE